MFNIKPLTNEIVSKIDTAGCHDHVEVSLSDGSSRSCVMIQKFIDQFAERIKKMEVYDDDVWIVTFPKCGTTWTQEMVWLVNNNLDYGTASKVNLNDRYPFLE
jgi:sulfotransferase